MSDGTDISTEDLVHGLYAGFAKPSRLIPCPKDLLVLREKLFEGQVWPSPIVDSSKIQSELDWNPPYTSAEGLRETVRWYKGMVLQDV